MQARPYQQKCIESVESSFKDVSRLLASVPTGGGKTIIFSWLAQRRQPERTLILAHREELINQAIDKLHNATGIMSDKEQAENYASLSAPVVVASVQSMIRRLDRWPQDHFGLVIVDECHHAISDSYLKVLHHFDGHSDVLGVTASPDRGDKRNLGEYFDKIAFEIGLFDLINDGYLSRIIVKAVPLKIDLNNVRQTAGDFDCAQLSDVILPYLGEIARAIQQHASFRRTLVFVPLIATSQKFVEVCESIGLSACHIDGASPDRADILKQFRDGKFDVLSNAMLLTEGYDDPGIDCVVVLRPTKSRALYSQMVGRGTRILPTKDNLLLLDFLWNHQKLALCRPAHLIAKSAEEAEAITEATERKAAAIPGDVAEQIPMDLEGLASDVQIQREAALKKRLEEQKNKKGKTISAEEFAVLHENMDIATYEPTMKWESEPITDKQAKYLKKAGIDLSTVKGKGHASKLLDIHFGSTPIQLAPPKAIELMTKLRHICAAIGISDPANATQAESRRFFAELNRRKTAKTASSNNPDID